MLITDLRIGRPLMFALLEALTVLSPSASNQFININFLGDGKIYIFSFWFLAKVQEGIFSVTQYAQCAARLDERAILRRSRFSSSPHVLHYIPIDNN